MAVGQPTKKFTWLLDNVEVKGIVNWIDPISPDGVQPDEFGIAPDENYSHLIAYMRGNNPLLFRPSDAPGELLCETYPLLGADDSNRLEPWSLSMKPDSLPFEVTDPSTGQKRPMMVGDHIRVIGRLVIDHHPEYCLLPAQRNPPEPDRCRARGALMIGPSHMELHPIRWDSIELVVPSPPGAVAREIISIAAPLHEEVYFGAGKWLGNELAGVSGKVFVAENETNYHNTVQATANIKAPALTPLYSADASLIGFSEYVFGNGTGLDVPQIRTLEITADGIRVTASVTAPQTQSSGGIFFGDIEDPANGSSVFQAQYSVWWRRRLVFVNLDGTVYSTDDPSHADSIQFPDQPVGESTSFVIFAKNVGPDPIELVEATLEPLTLDTDPGAPFSLAPVQPEVILPGHAVDIQVFFRPPGIGGFTTKLVLQSTDPGHERLALDVKGSGIRIRRRPL